MELSGTFGGVLVAVLVASSALHVWFAWKMEREARAVILQVAEIAPIVRSYAEMGSPMEAIEDVRDEIAGTINAVLGQMHVPTAGDHLMGTVSAIAQAYFLGPMQKAAQMLPETPDPANEPD